MSSRNPPPPPPGQGAKGKQPIRQAPEVPSGATTSSMAPTARPLVPNAEARIVVVLIHGLNSSEAAFIGSDGSSWATELNQQIEPLIGQSVEVVQVGWETSPLNPANTSLNIPDTTPFLLTAIADAVNGRQWVAVGHSMGGMEILAAMGTAFAETSQQGGNPTTQSTQTLQKWETLMDNCFGIFRLASPGQGSPWGQFGLIVAKLVPHANPDQIRGLVVDSQQQKQITASSNEWFKSRQDAGRTVNVFSAQETEPVVIGTPKIVDYDGSLFNVSSTRLTNSTVVRLPGESHTSAPKAPAGSSTGNALVAGVVFCITGKVPQGSQLTPGLTKKPGAFGTIKRMLPSPGTLKKILPGASGSGSGSGGSSSRQIQGQNPEEDPEQNPQQNPPPTS